VSYNDPMNLLEQIRADRDETIEKRSRLLASVAELDAKLAELDAALRTLGRYDRTASGMSLPQAAARLGKLAAKSGGKPAAKPIAAAAGDDGPTRGAKRRRIERALERAYPKGVTIPEIRDDIMATEHAEVSVNTITVTLGRMRTENRAKLQGRAWSLTRKPGG